MTIPSVLGNAIRIPAVCAPMIGISGPALVTAACKAGIMAGLPRHNAASVEQFEEWLRRIRLALDRYRDESPGAAVGPLAVNLSGAMPPDDIKRELALCRHYGVEVFISARGDPTELAKRVHDSGGLIFHDVINHRFAEKAIEAQVDGITCIAAGGGGHAGTISPFALVPQIRRIFDGTILLGGAISTVGGIRAAEALGADLAYLGTRFIATTEANADQRYKAMIVAGRAEDVVFSSAINGVGANWLTASLRDAGLDPAKLPRSPGRGNYSHLPAGTRPWRDLWSAGQGIASITAIEPVAQVVDRLVAEYEDVCAIRRFTPVNGAGQRSIVADGPD